MEVLHKVIDAARVWSEVPQGVKNNQVTSKELHAGGESPDVKVYEYI